MLWFYYKGLSRLYINKLKSIGTWDGPSTTKDFFGLWYGTPPPKVRNDWGGGWIFLIQFVILFNKLFATSVIYNPNYFILFATAPSDVKTYFICYFYILNFIFIFCKSAHFLSLAVETYQQSSTHKYCCKY